MPELPGADFRVNGHRAAREAITGHVPGGEQQEAHHLLPRDGAHPGKFTNLLFANKVIDHIKEYARTN